MALNAPRNYIQLAQTLPPQLTRFFARYPPAAILSQTSTSPSPLPTSSTSPTPILSSDSSASSSYTTSTTPPPSQPPPNPFLPQKSPITQKWHDPIYSLRRQADLVKLARQYGVEELLPFTVKKTEERIGRRLEFGLRVKGTGVGEKVRGKISERGLKNRLEKRRQAMLGMPQLIQEWKVKGHGRGWKKWPKP